MSGLHPDARIERGIRQRVLASYRRAFPEPPERIVIGFSGGNDSTALALLLIGLGPLIESGIELLHVDHRMRPGSGDDATATLQLANELHSPASIITAVEPPEVTHRASDRETARRVRFASLANSLEAGEWWRSPITPATSPKPCSCICYEDRRRGHRRHRGAGNNECAVVERFRGCIDITGLAPAPSRVQKRSRCDRCVARAASIEDETNLDPAYRRNLIRHRLLPVLREIEPSVDERLGTLAEIARDENAWIESITASMLAPFEGEPGLRVDLVSQSPVGLSRRIVRHWCRSRFNHELTFERVEAVRELCGNPNGAARIEIGDNLYAWRDRTFLYVGANPHAESDSAGAI
ncbi:MAG: ATP-binding protein [Thermomicrobiales bacterium]